MTEDEIYWGKGVKKDNVFHIFIKGQASCGHHFKDENIVWRCALDELDPAEDTEYRFCSVCADHYKFIKRGIKRVTPDVKT